MAAKNKGGRPRTTLDKLPRGWEDLIQARSEEGASAIEVRGALGIGRSAWDTLLADSPEFQSAVKKAEEACNIWWERLGRDLARNGGGNSAVWIFNMKNRFGWRDKQEDATPSDQLPHILSDLIAKLPS